MAKKSKVFVKKIGDNDIAGKEECLREYVKIHDIDADGAETVAALSQIVDEANSGESLYCTECSTKTRDTDTFCPFCGADVSEDDTGGWDNYLAAREPQEVIDERLKEESEEACVEEPGDSGGPGEPDDIETLEPIDSPEDFEKPGKTAKVKKEKKIHVDDKTVDYNHAGVGVPESDVPRVEDAPETEDDGRSLTERIEKVHDLETHILKTGGEGAWDLGRELFGIHASKRYSEGGYETFRDFAEGEPKKGGLGMSYQNAMNYIKVFKVHTRELAGQLGFDKAARLALAPEPVKLKLLKPQTDGLPLAAHLPKAELNERIVEAATKARERENPEAPPRGRPTKSKFENLLIERKRTAAIRDDGPTIFKLDGKVAVEVLVNTKDGKVSIQFVEIAE